MLSDGDKATVGVNERRDLTMDTNMPDFSHDDGMGSIRHECVDRAEDISLRVAQIGDSVGVVAPGAMAKSVSWRHLATELSGKFLVCCV